jgi:hypothetical protein
MSPSESLHQEIPPAAPADAPSLAFAEKVKTGVPGRWIASLDADESFLSSAKAADTILLLDRQYHAELGECFHRTVRRLETMQAVDEAAQWRLDFDPATQSVTVHSLTVRRADAAVNHAQGAQFRFLHRDNRLESVVLNGWMVAVVLIQDIRVGDILDVSYTVKSTPRFLTRRFWMLEAVPPHPALHIYHASVRFATVRNMRWTGNNAEFSPAAELDSTETVWNWELKNPTVPPAEPGIPWWYCVTPRLQVTDCESWEEVSRSMAALWHEDFRDPVLVGLAKEISTGFANPEARAERALTLVQDEIRHVEMNTAPCEQSPALPGTVLRRRFGDSKDKSYLLVHLLRLLGIAARPVLVHTLLRKTIGEFLPAPDVFNHVVVEYAIGDEHRWVDATLPQQGGGALGRSLPDYGWGLPLGPGVANLEPVFPPPNANDRYELREIFLLDTSGLPSRLEISLTATGIHADELRRSFAMEGADAVAERRESFYKQMYPEIRRIVPIAWRDDRGNNTVVLSELYHLPGAVTRNFDGKTCSFQHNAHLVHSILGFPALEKRHCPLHLEHPCNIEQIIEVESPALPTSNEPVFARPNQTFHFVRESKLLFYRWTFHYKLKTLTDTVTPKQYRAHRLNILAVWPSTQLQVILPIGVPATKSRPRSPDLQLPSPRSASAEQGQEQEGGGFAMQRSSFDFPTGPEFELQRSSKPSQNQKHERILKMLQIAGIGFTILVLFAIAFGAYQYHRSHLVKTSGPRINWKEIDKLKKSTPAPDSGPSSSPAEPDVQKPGSVILQMPDASSEQPPVSIPLQPDAGGTPAP